MLIDLFNIFVDAQVIYDSTMIL